MIYSAFLVWLILMMSASMGYAVTWPIKLHSSGHYFTDSADKPFLIVADAGWELTTQITDADAITYVNDRAAKGFTGIEIRIIGHIFQNNAPNDYYSNVPFTNGQTDWTVRNETYWARMDTILTHMKDHGIVAIVFPCYAGAECGEQGWCADMNAQSNDNMTSYGTFIGNRYKDYGNVLWMMGGDCASNSTPNILSRMTAVHDAIKAADTDALFSAEPAPDTIAGIDANSWSTIVDIAGIYSYSDPIYEIGRAYTWSVSNNATCMFQEGWYENEWDSTIVHQETNCIGTILGGCLGGHIFGSCPLWGFGATAMLTKCDSSSSPFNTWQNNMASPGSVSIGNMSKLLRSRAWAALVPDTTGTVMTSSKGSYPDYFSTAVTSDGETIIAWFPTATLKTIDMEEITSTDSQAKAWWWDPDTNVAAVDGTYANTGTRNFTPASARLVLVIDANDSALAAPGSFDYYGTIATITGVSITGVTIQ